jgi:hypothetical protein
MLLGLGLGQCQSVDPTTQTCLDTTAATYGEASEPNCFAGTQLVTLPDGTYACSPTINEQTLGTPAPNCSSGAATIDENGDWTCPPPPTSTAQTGFSTSTLLLLAAAGFGVYYWYSHRGSAPKGESI